MNLKACYSNMNGDLDGTLSRLGSENLLQRLLLKFLEDKSMDDLKAGLTALDASAAFKAVHTLKGLALNLGFTALSKSASELTEILRGGSLEGSGDKYQEVLKDYQEIIKAIQDNN